MAAAIPPSFIVIMVGMFGLALGSFVTMASYRIPRGEDLVFKPSRCPSCEHRLGFWDLFPVVSWVIAKGRCQYCRTKVSIRYPLTELVMAAVCVLIYLVVGLNLITVILWAVSVCLLIMVVIDLEYQIIPDGIQISLAVLGIAYDMVTRTDMWPIGAAAGLAVALFLRWGFWLWKKREGLGLGDVKFFAVVGLFLGAPMLVPFMVLSGVMGIATAFVWKRLGRSEEFPFGPALAVALLMCLLFRPLIWGIFFPQFSMP